MRCSVCILHAVISAVPTGWPRSDSTALPDAYAAASYRDVLYYSLIIMMYLVYTNSSSSVEPVIDGFALLHTCPYCEQ